MGGTCGLQVKKGKLLAKDLSDDQAMDYIGKIIDSYNEKGIQKRLGRVIDKIGLISFLVKYYVNKFYLKSFLKLIHGK